MHDVEIPALLIQPYVENALLHGLLPNFANGLLKSGFRNEDDYIRRTIEDKGIGRAAAS